MKRKSIYIITAVLTFTICVLIIILFDNNHFIRGFLGDIIVITFIYSVVKIFIDINPIKLCVFILLFAYTVEFLQYLRFIEVVGLKDNVLAKIVLGTTFDTRDLLAYTLGFIFTYMLEIKLFNRFSG